MSLSTFAVGIYRRLVNRHPDLADPRRPSESLLVRLPSSGNNVDHCSFAKAAVWRKDQLSTALYSLVAKQCRDHGPERCESVDSVHRRSAHGSLQLLTCRNAWLPTARDRGRSGPSTSVRGSWLLIATRISHGPHHRVATSVCELAELGVCKSKQGGSSPHRGGRDGTAMQ